jgi:hypothetical protein
MRVVSLKGDERRDPNIHLNLSWKYKKKSQRREIMMWAV